MFPNDKEILWADDRVTESNISELFPAYMGNVFEGMCGEYVRSMGYPVIGKRWGDIAPAAAGGREIDVIGKRRTPGGRTEGLFAQCKYRGTLVGTDVPHRLKEASSNVRGFDTRNYALFSKSGFTDNVKAIAGREGAILVRMNPDRFVGAGDIRGAACLGGDGPMDLRSGSIRGADLMSPIAGKVAEGLSVTSPSTIRRWCPSAEGGRAHPWTVSI